MNIIKFLFLTIFGLSQIYSFTQITITQDSNASSLINNLIDNSIIYSNASINCPNGASGTFANNTTNNLGMEDGIVLSTGSVLDIAQNSTSFANTSYSASGDWDLDSVLVANGVTYTTNDACVLEFDMLVPGDTLILSYVFSSEEYTNYVCSGFNDLFALFITGPNPSSGFYDTVNIATIPNTLPPIAVGINTVNDGTPNGTDPGCIDTNTVFYNYSLPNIVYDGNTIKLKASIPTIQNQTYHIKIAIADGGDYFFDSGLFLEGFTFTQLDTLAPIISYSNIGIDSLTMNLGCDYHLDSIFSNYDLPNGNELEYQIVNDSVLDSLGTQTIQVYVIDGLGLSSDTLNAYVSVLIDTVYPIITLLGFDTLEIHLNTSYLDSGITYFDNACIDTVYSVNNVDTSTVGSYTYSWFVVDLGGNLTTVDRFVNVVLPPDTTDPFFVILGSYNMLIEACSSFNDPGVLALDEVDGNITSSVIVYGSIDSSVIGTDTLTYYVEDAMGNSASIIRVVTVEDTQSPIINLNFAGVYEICLGDTFIGPNVTVDDCDTTTLTNNSSSINTNIVGVYSVTYTAVDGSGNASTATLQVEIGSYGSVDIQTVCNSYTWIDGNTYFSNNNTAIITLTSVNGCDSIITLDLTVFNLSTSTDIQTAVSPYLWIDGNTYTSNNNTANYTLTNSVGCDSIITLDLTIVDTVIQGNITTSNSMSLLNSKVYLIKYFSAIDSVFAQDSTTTDANGFYQFTNVFDNAYIKAVPNISTYPNEVPTYNINSPVFQLSDAVSLISSVTVVDFSTIAGINPGGNGFIGGIVGNGAGKNSEVGQPLSGLSLLLMNSSNEVVKQTTTNNNGEFSFDNLEEATFSLWVDKAGVLNNLSPSISLVEDNNQDNLKFTLHKTYLEDITTVGVKSIEKSIFSIYPNPTNDKIIIHSIVKNYSFEIISILGETVSSNTANSTKTIINFDKLGINKGTYFIKISTENSSYISKLVFQ